MKHISSRDNPHYRQLAKLSQDRVAGQCLLEGIHLCQEWLRHQGQPLQAVFDASRIEPGSETAQLLNAIDPSRVLVLDMPLFERLSAVRSSQGVCFAVAVSQPHVPERIVQNCLWLDRVQDPGNVGSMMRTAAAAGIAEVYLSAGCARVWSQKVLRSAQGAHFALRVYEDQSLEALQQRLAIPLLASSLDSASSLYEGPLPLACAWLFGNEGQGVDARLQALASRRIFIPQASAVESLNVAAAAAICLFEQRRQFLLRS